MRRFAIGCLFLAACASGSEEDDAPAQPPKGRVSPPRTPGTAGSAGSTGAIAGEVPPHGKALVMPGPKEHHGEPRGIRYGQLIGDRVVRQASASAAKHGGKACATCAATQAEHGVTNVTGKQGE